MADFISPQRPIRQFTFCSFILDSKIKTLKTNFISFIIVVLIDSCMVYDPVDSSINAGKLYAKCFLSFFIIPYNDRQLKT